MTEYDHCLICGADLCGSLHALCNECAEQLGGQLKRGGMSLPLWDLPRKPETFASVAQLREYTAQRARQLGEKGAALPTTTEQARQYAARRLPKEERYQTAIMDALRDMLPHAVIYKQQASIYAKAGLPDVTVVVGGRHLALEVKRPIVGVVSPLQRRMILSLREAGAIAYVVSTPAEARAIVDKYELWRV